MQHIKNGTPVAALLTHTIKIDGDLHIGFICGG
jgi:hypothetical protein